MVSVESPSTTRRGRVEDHCCIDVSLLHKGDKLVPGTCCVWGWSRSGSPIGVVHLVAGIDSIEIICGYVVTKSGTEPAQEVLQINRVPARFANRPCERGRGAQSTFLLCPRCRSRRRKLYIVGAQCRRRDCHRLGFAVETKGPAGRCLQKAAKARARLAAAPGIVCPVPICPVDRTARWSWCRAQKVCAARSSDCRGRSRCPVGPDDCCRSASLLDSTDRPSGIARKGTGGCKPRPRPDRQGGAARSFRQSGLPKCLEVPLLPRRTSNRADFSGVT